MHACWEPHRQHTVSATGVAVETVCTGPHLGDHGEVVDHVGVDDGVDDGLAHVTPARIVHVSQDICVRLIRQQCVQQRHMPVFQHAVVIVQSRVLMPRIYEECIVQACTQGRPTPSIRRIHGLVGNQVTEHLFHRK